MSTDYGQTLAAFVLDSGKQSRRLLKRIQEIDDVDPNVKIVDAAIADRTRFRVKVHQTAESVRRRSSESRYAPAPGRASLTLTMP